MIPSFDANQLIALIHEIAIRVGLKFGIVRVPADVCPAKAGLRFSFE
jgi:hypothetical protein